MTPTKDNILELYKGIDPLDYLQKVAFYEEKMDFIEKLDTKQQHFFKYEYIQALFDLGRYEQVLLRIDKLIEYIFLNNISYGQDTFAQLVFLKAASFYDLQDYTQAIKFGEQLVGICPQSVFYQKFLRKAYYQNNVKNGSFWRTSFMTLIILSALMSGLFVYSRHTATGEYLFYCSLILNGFIITGFTAMYITYYLRSKRSLDKLIEKVKRKGVD